MGKGLGIAALIFAIVSIFIPFASLYVMWIALALTASAAFARDRRLSIAAFAVVAVNLFFLSPVALAAVLISSSIKVITAALFLAVILGWVTSARKNSSTPQAPPSGSPDSSKRAPPPSMGGESTNSNLKPCPFCAELIQPAARKCRFCNSDLPQDFNIHEGTHDERKSDPSGWHWE